MQRDRHNHALPRCIPDRRTGASTGSCLSEQPTIQILQLAVDILPQLSDDEEKDFVTYDRFEMFMLKVIIQRLFEPDSTETVLQAFKVKHIVKMVETISETCVKVLDAEDKGFLSENQLIAAMISNDYGFRDKEIEDFLRVAKDPDTGHIFYQDCECGPGLSDPPCSLECRRE